MLYKRIYVPDCHFPEHDGRAFQILLSFMHDFKPDEVVILGDFFDVSCVSSFDKDPRRDHRFLSDELAYGISYVKQLDSLYPNTSFVFLEGNHETRIKRYLFSNAPKIADRIDMKQILGIPERWRYLSYGQNGHYRHGDWVATHGTVFNKHVASSMVMKYGTNVIFGHVHRIQEHYYTKFNGEVLKAVSPGWLGDVTKADYIKDVADWQHGFAVGYFKKNGEGFVQPIPIIKHQAVIEGRLYKNR